MKIQKDRLAEYEQKYDKYRDYCAGRGLQPRS
jgi:hypothetical protein